MATVSERLKRDFEAAETSGGSSFDVAMAVPLRELRHEAADTIDSLVAALSEVMLHAHVSNAVEKQADAALALARKGR